MTAQSRRPVEVLSSRRRASTANSTGLEYNSYRVEDDILSRIRSLLLSRNIRCPPRTPHSSDEDRNRCSEHYDTSDTVDRFDFSTAQSAVRSARSESGGLGFATTVHLRSQSEIPSMDGARRPTVPIHKRSTLRSTSSTNDLNTSIEDATVHVCPQCPPEETRKPFRLPRLVIKDKREKKETRIFGPASTLTPKAHPRMMPRSIRTDLPCCHPCDPRDVRRSKSVDRNIPSVGTIRTEPADLACFLAGCSPGPGECKKHRRRSSQFPLSPKRKINSRMAPNLLANA